MKNYTLPILMAVMLISTAFFGTSRTGIEPVPQPEPAPLAEPAPALPPAAVNPEDGFSQFEYGRSGLNRPLTAYKITGTGAGSGKKIMCVFGIHGFEDAWYRDGEELVKIADEVVRHFREHREELEGCELVVVPCANPDGIYEGWTCNGPGRTQLSPGIDINMDFDYRFKVRNNLRNKTGSRPFSSPEGAALRDLVLEEKPDIIIDFQGWINSAAGDKAVSEVFCRNLGVNYDRWEEVIYPGFFVGWAAKHARAVLVEYPNPFTGQGSLDNSRSSKKLDQKVPVEQWGFTEKTIKSIREIVALSL